MESIQLIKNRIQSIAGTKQITQSMRLVASSKVQRTRVRLQDGRPFLEQARALTALAAAGVEYSGNPYLTQREGAPLVVLISGDRGLCGGYNASVIRTAADLIRGTDARLIAVGGKARDYFRGKKGVVLGDVFTGISENPFFADAVEIAQPVLRCYRDGEVSRVDVVYTRFRNMLSQEPQVLRLLPFQRDSAVRPVTCEPQGEGLLERVIPFYVAATLYGAMLESAVSEQSARVASMDAATKNSGEMMDELTLLYNQARQGAITQEIIEIVAGAGAV